MDKRIEWLTKQIIMYDDLLKQLQKENDALRIMLEEYRALVKRYGDFSEELIEKYVRNGL